VFLFEALKVSGTNTVAD